VASREPASTRAGPADQFGLTVLPHLDAAYNLACYLTRDPLLSEDIVQDAFLRAFRAFGDLRGGSAKPWLLAIVRNCCRTAMSQRSRSAMLTVEQGALSAEQAQSIEQHPDAAADPEQDFIRREGIGRARALLDALPEPFREALVLREMEELSYKEIADVMGVAIGTVMSRLSRARMMIAESATEDMPSPGQARSLP
jgi:RNA polymerase sigma-70 factor (ECF subfamily)